MLNHLLLLFRLSFDLDCGNYWSSLKKLNQLIAKVVLTQSSESLYDLDILLKRHKPDLLSLLKNEVLLAPFCRFFYIVFKYDF